MNTRLEVWIGGLRYVNGDSHLVVLARDGSIRDLVKWQWGHRPKPVDDFDEAIREYTRIEGER